MSMFTVPNKVEADLPPNLMISTTDVCNIKCVMCQHARIQEGWRHMSVPPSDLHPFVRSAKQVSLHGIGEPLMHRKFWDFIPDDVAYENRVGWVTNGLLFTESNVTKLFEKKIAWLDISMDAGTRSTYKAIRGGDWKTLWECIARIIRHRQDKTSPFPELYANMTLMHTNILEVATLAKLLPQEFESLHLFHLNPLESAGVEEWKVPYNDKVGTFNYEAQSCADSTQWVTSVLRTQMRTLSEAEVPLKVLFSGRLIDHDSCDHKVIYDGSEVMI